VNCPQLHRFFFPVSLLRWWTSFSSYGGTDNKKGPLQAIGPPLTRFSTPIFPSPTTFRLLFSILHLNVIIQGLCIIHASTTPPTPIGSAFLFRRRSPKRDPQLPGLESQLALCCLLLSCRGLPVPPAGLSSLPPTLVSPPAQWPNPLMGPEIGTSVKFPLFFLPDIFLQRGRCQGNFPHGVAPAVKGANYIEVHSSFFTSFMRNSLFRLRFFKRLFPPPFFHGWWPASRQETE